MAKAAPNISPKNSPENSLGVLWTPQQKIPGALGSVYRGIKATDDGFAGFGEAYFSTVKHAAVKGWKFHHQMTCNLIVAVGQIEVAVFDEKLTQHQLYSLGEANYGRLTLPPRVWFAFRGAGKELNLVLNVASIAHDPAESSAAALDDARFANVQWTQS